VKKILIVDFNEESLNHLVNLFTEKGFKVISARNGIEAYKKFNDEKPDLVITEILISGFDGLELCKKIAYESERKVPVLIFTEVYKDFKFKRDIIKSYGAFSFFIKPYQENELIFEVTNLLKGKTEEELQELLTTSITLDSFLEKSPFEEEKLSSTEIFQDILNEKKPEKDTIQKELEEVDRKLEKTLIDLDIDIKKFKKEMDFERKIEFEDNYLDENKEFLIIKKIGKGKSGEVYKAKRKGVEGFEKIVAIKKIYSHLLEKNENFLKILIREANLAAQFSHPNIIQVFDLRKENDFYFIIMEYVFGKDLNSVLKKLKKLNRIFPYVYTAFIGTKISEALNYLYKKKSFVHGNLNPLNILISYEGEVKISCLELMKVFSEIPHTLPSIDKNRISYMSPEHVQGKEILHASDIFSIGCLLFEMATGKKCFGGETEIEVLDKIARGEIVPPSLKNPDIPDELENIILKTLQFEPKNRYQCVGELKTDLEKFIKNNAKIIPSEREIGRFLVKLFADEIEEKWVISESSTKSDYTRSINFSITDNPPLKLPEDYTRVNPFEITSPTGIGLPEDTGRMNSDRINSLTKTKN
jgi:serine/threonine protein kinase/DNA-binding response OmpR family regulator